SRSGNRLDQARYEVSVALRRCTCAAAPDAAALTRKLPSVRTAYDLAQLSASADQARACSSGDAQRRDLDALDAKIQALRQAKAYCGSAAADLRRLARPKASRCYEAQLRRSAAGLASACGAGAVDDATVYDFET